MDAIPESPEIHKSFLKKYALFFKIAGVLVLALVLLIPLAMIQSLIVTTQVAALELAAT